MKIISSQVNESFQGEVDLPTLKDFPPWIIFVRAWSEPEINVGRKRIKRSVKMDTFCFHLKNPISPVNLKRHIKYTKI